MIQDLSNEAYHADKKALSSTVLSYCNPPAKYKAWVDGRIPRTESDALAFGSAYHTLILEPEKFEKEYVVMPKVDGRTKEGKAVKAEFEANYPNHTLLQQNTMDTLLRMRDAILQHDMAKEYLSMNGLVEQSIIWDQELDYRTPDVHCCNECWSRFNVDFVEALEGVVTCPTCKAQTAPAKIRCKTRPDFYTPSFVIDLKTADSANPSFFYWKVAKGYNYKRQAAFQLAGLANEGIIPEDYYWLAQEKEPPYLVSMNKASEQILLEGHHEFLSILTTIRECRDMDVWPAYPGITEINHPEKDLFNVQESD